MIVSVDEGIIDWRGDSYQRVNVVAAVAAKKRTVTGDGTF